MSDELTVKLDERKAMIESEFQKRSDEIELLGKERAKIDRRLQVLREEQLVLQGKFSEVVELIGNGEKEQPKLTPPKKTEKPKARKGNGKGD